METKMVDFNYVFFKILIDTKKFKLHINEGLDNIQYIYAWCVIWLKMFITWNIYQFPLMKTLKTLLF